MEKNKIYLGDNLELLKQLKDNSIDSCVSDFPYNLSFMGKKWDTIDNYYQWCKDRAIELYRVLKPGGFCLIFSGTRTQHRMVCGFEDAGFEIKDQIMWCYGQGFPKSYNISKGFDKKAGVRGEFLGNIKGMAKQNPEWNGTAKGRKENCFKSEYELLAPSTDLAKQWDGWGTAMKPTHEPIMVAQKPIEKNYCYNVEKWGVGGLNIDGCRIELNGEIVPINVLEKWSGFGEEDKPNYEATINTKGRYPTNTIFDETCAKILDEQSGFLKSNLCKNPSNCEGNTWGGTIQTNRGERGYDDSGGASRFFYVAKASQKERTENHKIENTHPTVKPISLITQLVKLVTPPNGISLDICEGSGSHALSCIDLSKNDYPVNYIGFENDTDSVKTANERIQAHETIISLGMK